MVSLAKVLQEAESVAHSESLQLVEVDRTDYVIKLRLLVDRNVYVQIYANAASNKLNLALIISNNRVYGFGHEGGFYHFHPFENPFRHIPAQSQKSIADFVKESLALLTSSGLL